MVSVNPIKSDIGQYQQANLLSANICYAPVCISLESAKRKAAIGALLS
jgi:hypothetical protein